MKTFNKKLLVRLTEDEKLLIDKRAREARLSTSRFLVKAGRLGKIMQRFSAAETEQIAKVSFHLSRTGTNLNQIAHNLNYVNTTGDDAAAPSAAEVRATLRELQDLIIEVRTLLSS
jgi:hypothetical protein